MLNRSNVINNSSSSVYSSCSNVSSSRVILPDKNKLKVLFSNVDTLTNKCNELQVYLDTESPDIIGLCEISPKNAMDKESISDLVLPSYERLVPGTRGSWYCIVCEELY